MDAYEFLKSEQSVSWQVAGLHARLRRNTLSRRQFECKHDLKKPKLLPKSILLRITLVCHHTIKKLNKYIHQSKANEDTELAVGLLFQAASSRTCTRPPLE